MNALRRAKLKEKIKNTPKKKWVFLGLWVVVIAVIITSLLVAMHLSGYTFVSFISHYWAWFVLSFMVLIIIVASIIFFKIRKK